MNQKLIAELMPGDAVLSFFIVRKKELKEKKSTNDAYLSFDFGDRSGRVRGSLWKEIAEANMEIQLGDVAKVKGRVITFLDQNHISIDKIRKATPDDHIDFEWFLPHTDQDVEKMQAELLSYLKKIKNPPLKNLINAFINDQQFLSRFCRAPGGKLWHHAYIGGLLEHTLSVMMISQFICQHYKKSVNSDLLLSAAFLHDIGKIEEFSTQGFINYSTPGRLMGHIVLGTNMIMEKISQVLEFPANLQEQILHCILSHHGQKERGSPVVPMTLEAIILNYVDELDSSVAAFQRIMSKEKEPGKAWSNYVNLIDRFLYLGENE